MTNKIKESNITDGAVTSDKLDANAVTSAKLSYPLTTFSSTGIDDNATSTAITIDSSDRVGINTTSPQRYLHITGNDGASGTSSGNSDTQVFIDNAGGNGAIIEFGSSNTGAGRIAFSDADGGNRGRLAYLHSTDHMEFTVNGSERMRIDSSGHAIIPAGVTLGTAAGTYNADNTLDDYEEGTWTPTYVAGGTNFTSITYQQQVGKYTKIGDTVILTVLLSTNAITKGSASGDVYIYGLPFVSNGNYSNGTILYNTANWAGDIPDGWTTFNNISQIYLFYKSSTTAVTNINPADMGTGGSANNFMATMIYKTNA